jgi:hypothetical protein
MMGISQLAEIESSPPSIAAFEMPEGRILTADQNTN